MVEVKHYIQLFIVLKRRDSSKKTELRETVREKLKDLAMPIVEEDLQRGVMNDDEYNRRQSALKRELRRARRDIGFYTKNEVTLADWHNAEFKSKLQEIRNKVTEVIDSIDVFIDEIESPEDRERKVLWETELSNITSECKENEREVKKRIVELVRNENEGNRFLPENIQAAASPEVGVVEGVQRLENETSRDRVRQAEKEERIAQIKELVGQKKALRLPAAKFV